MQINPITTQELEDLTLAVLYLTAWREPVDNENGNFDNDALVNWKGHNFEVLDTLAANKYTDGNRRSKSVQITEAGEAKAQEIIRRLLGKDFTVTEKRT